MQTLFVWKDQNHIIVEISLIISLIPHLSLEGPKRRKIFWQQYIHRRNKMIFQGHLTIRKTKENALLLAITWNCNVHNFEFFLNLEMQFELQSAYEKNKYYDKYLNIYSVLPGQIMFAGIIVLYCLYVMCGGKGHEHHLMYCTSLYTGYMYMLIMTGHTLKLQHQTEHYNDQTLEATKEVKRLKNRLHVSLLAIFNFQFHVPKKTKLTPYLYHCDVLQVQNHFPNLSVNV